MISPSQMGRWFTRGRGWQLASLLVVCAAVWIVLLLVDPAALWQPGTALSFASVVALLRLPAEAGRPLWFTVGTASAAAIDVEATMADDLTHTYRAEALSGAGANAAGLAGAIAVNVASGDTEASVDGGASLALTGGGGKSFR